MTHWVLQNNLYAEEGWDALVSALVRLDQSYSEHKCVPFAGTLEPEADPPPGPVIVMGSYTMARHAKERGWTPGAWLDNLDFEVQRKHWGAAMLNFDAEIFPFGAVPGFKYSWFKEPFFMRPVHDTKSFTGKVFDKAEYEQFVDGVYQATIKMPPDEYEKAQLTMLTPVMVCKKKEIYSETRTWVVGGEVVTASGYKLGTLKRYTPEEAVDPGLIAWADTMAKIWSPNEAYVMDVADTPTGYRIVEINNLNSAGFYKADMVALVGALRDLVEKS